MLDPDHPLKNRTGSPAQSRSEHPPEFERFLEGNALSWGGAAPLPPLKTWRNLAEAWRIGQALRACGGNRSAAARELGIGRRTLYAKMEKLGIEPGWRS